MRWLRKWRQKPQPHPDAVKALIAGQLSDAIRYGVNGDFQRGYVCALFWTWQSAGYPATAASIAAEAIVTAAFAAPSEEDAV